MSLSDARRTSADSANPASSSGSIRRTSSGPPCHGRRLEAPPRGQRRTAPNPSRPPRCSGPATRPPPRRSACARASRSAAGKPGCVSLRRCPCPGRRRRGAPTRAGRRRRCAARRHRVGRVHVVDHQGQVDVRGGEAADRAPHGDPAGHRVLVEEEPRSTSSQPMRRAAWRRRRLGQPEGVATAGSISPTAPSDDLLARGVVRHQARRTGRVQARQAAASPGRGAPVDAVEPEGVGQHVPGRRRRCGVVIVQGEDARRAARAPRAARRARVPPAPARSTTRGRLRRDVRRPRPPRRGGCRPAGGRRCRPAHPAGPASGSGAGRASRHRAGWTPAPRDR